MKRANDQGNAVVEFIGVAIALLVPIAFVASAVLTVAQSYLAADVAARAASRAYVTAESEKSAKHAAKVLVRQSLRDLNSLESNSSVKISCRSSPCLKSGNYVSVIVTNKVPLNLPKFLGSHSVVVTGKHTSVVDELRSP